MTWEDDHCLQHDDNKPAELAFCPRLLAYWRGHFGLADRVGWLTAVGDELAVASGHPRGWCHELGIVKTLATKSCFSDSGLMARS